VTTASEDRPIPGTAPWLENLARIDGAMTPAALRAASVLFSIERHDRVSLDMPRDAIAPIYRELAFNLMNDAHRAALIEALQAMGEAN
jgi:hypothetical protein